MREEQETMAQEIMAQGFLTFASFQNNRRSGWGIGQQAGLNDAESKALVEVVPTVIDSPIEIPKYPNRDEIAAMDRRTAVLDAPWQQSGHPGDRVFIYSTPVGEDTTGRRGNIFTQAYVLRGGFGGQRATDFLDSDGLLTPFGPQEVNSIPALDGQLRKGPCAIPENVWNWIFDDGSPVDRAAVHRAVLSAVNHVLKLSTQQRVVAIACPNQEAKFWLSALFLSASPASLSALNWSTFERARNLSRAVEAGYQVVSVPLEDYDAAAANPDVICIRTDKEPDVQNIDGEGAVHILNETKIPVSAWEVLFEYQCFDADSASAKSCNAVETNEQGHPSWHLVSEAVMDDGMLRYLREPIRQQIAAGPLPANLSDRVFDKLLTEYGPSQLCSRRFPELHRQLMKWETLGLLSEQEIEQAIRGSDFLDLVFEDCYQVRALPRSGAKIEKILQQLVSEDDRLYQHVVNAKALDPNVSKWLGLDEFSLSLSSAVLSAAENRNHRAVDLVDALLVSAWALGKVADSNSQPKGQDPFASGFSASSFTEPSFGSDLSTSIGPENSDFGVTTAPVLGAHESRAIAFGLNSIETVLDSEGPGWQENISIFTPVIRDAKSLLSAEGKDVLALGMWRNVLVATQSAAAPPAPEKMPTTWETPSGSVSQNEGVNAKQAEFTQSESDFAPVSSSSHSPGRRPGRTAAEITGKKTVDFGTRSEWGQGAVEQERETERLDHTVTPFTDQELAALAGATPAEISSWVKEEHQRSPLFPKNSYPEVRLSKLSGIFFGPIESNPLLYDAFVSLICWAIEDCSQFFQQKQAVSVYLPWWRVDFMEESLFDDLAQSLLAAQRDRRTSRIKQKNQHIAKLEIPGISPLTRRANDVSRQY